MPTRTLISDVRADAFDGLTAYILGNGLQTRCGFDRAGRLNALHIDGVGELRYGHEAGPRILRIDVEADFVVLADELWPWHRLDCAAPCVRRR